MKKIMSTILVFILMISSVTNISALSVGTSGSSSLSPGANGSITFSASSGDAGFDGTVSSSDSSVVSIVGGKDLEGSKIVTFDSQSTITIKAHKAGTATISFSGDVSDGQTTKSFTTGLKVTVTAPSTGGNNSGNNNTGGHSVNNQTEKDKESAKQESAAEKEAREQREKEAEEARKKAEEERKKEELEAAKLVPLVTSINVISDSDKLNGEVLTEIKTEKDKFDYEYTLPRRVDAFKLDLKSDATLDYIKDHKFSDDENEKKIVVKAKNDDFDQTINIVVKRNTDPLLERAVGDKKLKVYDDELLNKLMEEKGFELKNFKEGEVEHTFFTKGKVNVQLLVDDKGAAQWYLLDGSNKAVEPVAFFLGKEGDVLFIKSPSEEVQKETLHGNKYEVKSRVLPKEFTEMDKELKIENKYGAWEFEDGEIVFAMDENLEEGLFHINSKELVKSAVVAFDQVDAKMKTIAIGTSVALPGLIAANIVYVVVNKKNENELI